VHHILSLSEQRYGTDVLLFGSWVAFIRFFVSVQ
jgi:hypothetical protein